MTGQPIEQLSTPPFTPGTGPCIHVKPDTNRSPDSIAWTPTRPPGILGLGETSPWHRDEARPLLQDLSNFIALGCLTSAVQLDCHDDAEQWTEIFQVNLPDLDHLQRILEDLISAGWLRVFALSGASEGRCTVLRLYALAADVGHRHINRADKHARTRLESLRTLVGALDTSTKLWSGSTDSRERCTFDMWAAPDSTSLFWIFNNIPSPAPEVDCVTDHFRKRALRDLLDPDTHPRGLSASLYPYQRRSAGIMLQRESENRIYLDPRLEERTAPDGSIFYYCPRDFHFLRQPRKYEAGKGGILAETMGLGKTVISLALILSTRGMLPKVPVEYASDEKYGSVRSLKNMCISATSKHSIPWKTYFEDYEARTGESIQHCSDLLEESTSSYEIHRIPPRFNRTTSLRPPDEKIMAATTIVVVPRNLLSQWESEIAKHTADGALNTLVMDDPKKELPRAEDLRKYDLILFGRSRFEQENRDGADEQGRRFSKTPLSCACPYVKATRTRDCTCLRPEDLYTSPLKKLHFLRIMIDEGHTFSTSTSIASTVANKLVTADHRWVVSGTPAKDLLGVEMDLYSSEQLPMTLHNQDERKEILAQRKMFNASEDTQGAVKSLGSLLGHFLQIRPWSEEFVSWDEYIYRHESAKKRTFSAFSQALRQTLEAVVIKTKPEDVEKDIELPPLTHNIVKLEPSFYDKITANLFTLVLTANAVTSERTDRDYLFHKDSAGPRKQLIANLRQSAFTWTGFSRADIEAAIGNCRRYLEKPEKNCSESDRELLEKCIEEAEYTLTLDGWNGMSSTHELGLYVKDWPEDSAEHWTLDGVDPVFTGATQLTEAQHHVHDKLWQQPDAEISLAGEGIKALSRARARGREEDQAAAKNTKSSSLVSSGVPSSGVVGEPVKKRSPPRAKAKRSAAASASEEGAPSLTIDMESSPPPRKKRKLSSTPTPTNTDLSSTPPTPLPAPTLAPTSPFARAALIGTSSAKASYLLSSILRHQATEKSLVFYTGDNAAYYLAQCLDAMHVPHLIYARSLPAPLKASHVVAFNAEPRWRVMLMDVGQAALGLNLSAASRVYFVNAVCRPAVEAQAIKRAHRIGQAREVKVQTLVLKGTVEEGMWERARRMSREEHVKAKALEDDSGVRRVIESAGLVGFTDGERDGVGEERVARLDGPEKVWCREGWAEWWREGREMKSRGGGKK